MDGWKRQTLYAMRMWSVIGVTVPFFFCVAVLFGANPVHQFWGTLIWSVFVSLLFLPGLQLLSNGQCWVKVISRVVLQSRLSDKSERWLCYCGLMILVGAWLGAFPILLDWNRPWQVWPIPSCIGAAAGSVMGYLGCALVHYCQKWRRKHTSV